MPEPGTDIGTAPRISGREIAAARPEKEGVDPRRPYDWLIERERTARGDVESVATIFLTNRECPFRCLMCDLWKYTTDETVREGAVPAQVDYALERLPDAPHVKLYNSGNFFDRKAFPPSDRPEVARRLDEFQTVVVENHPKLCGEACLRFRDDLSGQLEIAMGLETAHPEVLERLNKAMTLDDFRRAAGFLREADIDVRTFIQLRPPYLEEAEAVDWALRSVEVAFDAGVQCCSIVPTRPGNGIMERLAREGHFEPPSVRALETVLERGIRMDGGRVFADLWDLERFCDCEECAPRRRQRLSRMNLTQEFQPRVECGCGEGLQ